MTRQIRNGHLQRRLPLRGSSSSFWHVSQPGRGKPLGAGSVVLAVCPLLTGRPAPRAGERVTPDVVITPDSLLWFPMLVK
jgi:hypothetical protein